MLPRDLASIDQPEERVSLLQTVLHDLRQAAWLSDYRGLIDQAYDAVVKPLTSDWMMPNETGDRRPASLKRALELASIVEDSGYKLYNDFLHLDGRRLGEYLVAVRWATIAGLEGGGSDPLKIILS
ncbi:uncharacterized protein BJ212DRAFT_1580377 [Suillus subaureus]|uniref:Uncharacterized protein n=1 Tax=Suillus subaureus TaxID=48587 RepID=A0A9P7E055_9AGAM|nr:uncharacterized protein BJ212DRAFT_1580377 [Suillus subaureus]KAG1807267.1 hypothetical protein BJ212DRAFT_1580377 [Suillus subaureus]